MRSREEFIASITSAVTGESRGDFGRGGMLYPRVSKKLSSDDGRQVPSLAPVTPSQEPNTIVVCYIPYLFFLVSIPISPNIGVSTL